MTRRTGGGGGDSGGKLRLARARGPLPGSAKAGVLAKVFVKVRRPKNDATTPRSNGGRVGGREGAAICDQELEQSRSRSVGRSAMVNRDVGNARQDGTDEASVWSRS